MPRAQRNLAIPYCCGLVLVTSRKHGRYQQKWLKMRTPSIKLGRHPQSCPRQARKPGQLRVVARTSSRAAPGSSVCWEASNSRTTFVTVARFNFSFLAMARRLISRRRRVIMSCFCTILIIFTLVSLRPAKVLDQPAQVVHF